jgi:hypothetical protein
VSGANLIFTNNCLVFQTFPIRITAGPGYIKTLKELPRFDEELVIIPLIQIVFVEHGLYISKYGYLIFLRIVIMNLKNRLNTQQGFVQFIIPAQQWSTSLMSHRSSQDSTQKSLVYLPPNWGGGGSRVDSHISNPWSHAQPTHVVQGRGTKDSICPKFPRFVSVVGSNIFLQQLNFPRPSFPRHCNKRPVATLHMVLVYVLGLPRPPIYV